VKSASTPRLRLDLNLAISLWALSMAWLANAPDAKSQGLTMVAVDNIADKT